MVIYNINRIGHMNPKCTKWIHRNIFPCCFGRDALIPNSGYVSLKYQCLD